MATAFATVLKYCQKNEVSVIEKIEDEKGKWSTMRHPLTHHRYIENGIALPILVAQTSVKVLPFQDDDGHQQVAEE